MIVVGAACPTVTRISPSGNRCTVISCKATPKSISQPPRIGDTGWQALDGELVHGVTWPGFSIA